MKKALLLLCSCCLALSLYGQASGGQITRKPQKNTVSNNKKQGISKNSASSSGNSRSKKTIINNIIKNMVLVTGGSFSMGGTSEQGGEAENNEKPVHSVTISSFYINKYEVTVEEWNAVMGIDTKNHRDDKKPISNVSWNDCQDFINTLNQLTGKRFRLPTEAEWEYAARGGRKTNNYKYPGSDDPSCVARTGDLGNVGSYRSNELGLYDMAGNVWEWCQDIYGPYDSFQKANPRGALSGKARVIRGGGFNSPNSDFRVSSRWWADPDTHRRNVLGFRLAQNYIY